MVMRFVHLDMGDLNQYFDFPITVLI